MATTHKTKVLIIGSGPAGYTAAIYASRSCLSPILVSGPQLGGQLTTTPDIENYPGFEKVSGIELMDKMKAHAEAVGTKVITDTIVKVDFNKCPGTEPFVCYGEEGDIYEADTVIIATGASARYLGLESEEKFKGFGVSGCATCDGFFYKGKDVVVVGGGNTAVEDALYLTNIANSITLIHRRDTLRADKIAQQKLFSNEKITVIWDSVVEEILGTEEGMKSVTGIKIKNVKDNQTSEIKCDGVFIAIGHNPNTSIFEGILDLDVNKYIAVPAGTTATNIEGIFAAGDVREPRIRQAVMAAGNGCMAAIEAEQFLSLLEVTPTE